MKKFFGLGFAIFLVVSFVVGVCIVQAGTAGGIAPAVGKVNVPLTVAKPSKSACTTLGAGRATSTSVDVSGTTMLNFSAKDTVTTSSAGTDAAVKLKWNSNTAYMPYSGLNKNIPVSSSASSAVFTRYSGNSTITLCTERN